ncbi:MAG: AAA family ATPase [Candidatus Omnitrophica bacterium]|nr:AAA family ATPase [Candidatus Omnitrophota bacterium]MBU4488322.1 AAA family ATPase [Candidatus Omnitrophota bacterium]MCG2704972.1 AAA family ATPase [Candidatus Omnitrophota bacterium]
MKLYTDQTIARDPLPTDLDMNDEFKSAFDLMENTKECLFITGKAGTGKSTLLKYFKANTGKRIIVLAPTGVAAINVGGQTIHSFFRLPPKIIRKDTIKRLRDKSLVENLDMVIIDEVSMVRADIMDGIDYALRLNRGRMKIPFGGVQMVFFGDLFQLSPVVENEAKELMEELYPSPYFFSAKVFNDCHIRAIELSTIYRQKDSSFMELLNRVRNKEYAQGDLDTLNNRVQKDTAISKKDTTVILTTTNRLANTINQDRLSMLPGKEITYEATATGKFEESAYPTDTSLKLKKGAQVILIKNDPAKQWVNGTLAKVVALSNDSVVVDINGRTCDVPVVKWQKIEYSYDKDKDKIEDEVVGAFAQYPIKLAWAITIHKSQGQTFDKVIIDLGHGAFTHGQLYVALSRCTCLDGIMLKRPVTHRDIIFDRRIYEFKGRFASLF